MYPYSYHYHSRRAENGASVVARSKVHGEVSVVDPTARNFIIVM